MPAASSERPYVMRRGFPPRMHQYMPELTTGQSALLTDLALCVNHYRLFTPGIYVCVHVPVLLDANTRIVPGLVAMANHGRFKQCEALANGFAGPPNFVLDVFVSGQLDEYERRR